MANFSLPFCSALEPVVHEEISLFKEGLDAAGLRVRPSLCPEATGLAGGSGGRAALSLCLRPRICPGLHSPGGPAPGVEGWGERVGEGRLSVPPAAPQSPRLCFFASRPGPSGRPSCGNTTGRFPARTTPPGVPCRASWEPGASAWHHRFNVFTLPPARHRPFLLRRGGTSSLPPLWATSAPPHQHLRCRGCNQWGARGDGPPPAAGPASVVSGAWAGTGAVAAEGGRELPLKGQRLRAKVVRSSAAAGPAVSGGSAGSPPPGGGAGGPAAAWSRQRPRGNYPLWPPRPLPEASAAARPGWGLGTAWGTWPACPPPSLPVTPAASVSSGTAGLWGRWRGNEVGRDLPSGWSGCVALGRVFWRRGLSLKSWSG